MFSLWQGFPLQRFSRRTLAHSFRGEALYLPLVWKVFYLCGWSESTQADPQRREAIRRFHLWEDLFQSGTRKVHKKIHTKGKSFVCSWCNKKFYRSGVMKILERSPVHVPGVKRLSLILILWKNTRGSILWRDHSLVLGVKYVFLSLATVIYTSGHTQDLFIVL